MSDSLWPHEGVSLKGSSVHGILQARILEWVAISFPRGCFWSRDRICISYITGGFFFFNHWAIEIIFNQVVERLHFSILNKNNLNTEWSIDYCKVKCQHKVDINDFLYVEGQFSYHSIIKYIILLNIKKVDKLPIRRTFCPSNKCVHLCVWTDEASRGSSIKLQSILKTLAKWFLFWII